MSEEKRMEATVNIAVSPETRRLARRLAAASDTLLHRAVHKALQDAITRLDEGSDTAQEPKGEWR